MGLQYWQIQQNVPADGDKACRAALLDYIQKKADIKTCHRVMLDRYIDRKIQKTRLNCCTNSEELCNVCTAELLDSQQVGTVNAVQYLNMSVLSDADKTEFAMQETQMSVQWSKITALVRAEQLILE